VRVLDPACGSGNFLYVSLKELLDLEKEVSTYAGSIGLTPFFPEVGPDQLYGIETSPYAHELAQVAVWIGYLQWMVENGFGTRQEPILGPMTNIREMDAILTRDDDGTLREPDWPEADVIVGNPPFLGGSKVRGELGDEYVTELWKLYEGRVPGRADLVCYWFERAREQMEVGKAKRVGLLATNSIRGGSNRRVLEHIKYSGDIFFAESDRPWILNGAAVRVSMVGFDAGWESKKTLDGAPVAMITTALTGDLDLSEARALSENLLLCFRSDEKGGPFDIDLALAHEMLAAPANPNGRPNSDVVRPYVNGMDVTSVPA
jgi:type II restriction/modification system DNA methylase subunit YeeA